MHNGLDALQGITHNIPILHAATLELDIQTFEMRALSQGFIVQDTNVVTTRMQCVGEVHSNEAAASSYQNFHGINLVSMDAMRP
jgi:hypothetical protein